VTPSYDLLRFAQAVQREKDSALAAQVARDIDAARSSLADVVARMHAGLQRGESADVRVVLEAIEAQADIALRIVSRLADAARPREAERRRINVEQLTLEALAAVAPRLARGLALSASIAPALPPIAGDAQLLAEALVAILAFAQRALVGARRGGTIHVEVRSGAGLPDGAPCVAIRVSDAGPAPRDGTPPAPGPPPAAEPADAGLNRALTIIAHHGGTVSIENPGIGGVCLTLELPAE
jgi:signal transduction histidine kinase